MAITVYQTNVTRHSVRGYRTAYIVPVIADRITDKSVYVDGRRCARDSDWHQHHDTWERAHSFLLAEAKDRLNLAKAKLLGAEADLGDIEALTPPKE